MLDRAPVTMSNATSNWTNICRCIVIETRLIHNHRNTVQPIRLLGNVKSASFNEFLYLTLAGDRELQPG